MVIQLRTTIITIMLIASFITSYEKVEANGGSASSAAAAASAVAAAASSNELGYYSPPPSVHEDYPDEAAQVLQQNIHKLMSLLKAEVHTNPTFYDRQEIKEFFEDPNQWSFVRYLNQKNHNWKRAYRLLVKNLRWRAKVGLNRLKVNLFPCDLFGLGLIFEHRGSHQLLPNGKYIEGNPMIWIRLGALSNVIKYLEKPTIRRMASFGYNSARSVFSHSRNVLHHARTPGAIRIQSGRAPLLQNMSMKAEATVQKVLKAIAWWLEDWDRRHRPNQATLVLDFENTDYAFSSWSVGEFLIELDDHFPDLFDQIIGFRYRSKLWSTLPMSMFNRIFKSRFMSPAETDRKLKFVKSGPQIGRYMPMTDVEGFSTLPPHVSGECYGPIYQVKGCQNNPHGSDFDLGMWESIRNEFYRVCRPRIRQGY